MKYLDNNGLKTIFTKMKALFVTKSELDTKLKSVWGGIEEVVYIEGGYQADGKFFKFIKKGKNVDVYNTPNYTGPYLRTLPRNFQAGENIAVGTFYNMDITSNYECMLYIDGENLRTYVVSNYDSQIKYNNKYVGQYRLE